LAAEFFASAEPGGGVTDRRMPVSTRLVIGPNASLSDRQALGFFAVVCLTCLGIASVFAARGLWPVLPFAGLEVIAVGAALAVAMRRNRYREVVRFEGDRIRVEFGMVGEGLRSSCEWPRHLTRVWLAFGPHASSPSRLVMACGGQQLTIGHCLTDAERATLARRLKQLIHPAWLNEESRERAERPAT
jgi:uncharacterized membrane protein